MQRLKRATGRVPARNYRKLNGNLSEQPFRYRNCPVYEEEFASARYRNRPRSMARKNLHEKEEKRLAKSFY